MEKCEFSQTGSRGFNAKINCYLCSASIFSDNQIKCEHEDVLFPAVKVPKRFSLRNICRFLNINLSKDLIVTTDNLSVTLCEKCTSVSSGLSDLCMELEVLRMKVDHSLQIFFNAMNEAESEPVEADDIYKVNSVEDLRRKIKKRCDAKLNSILPKVLIKEETDIPPEKFSVRKTAFPQAPESTHFDDDYDDDEPEPEPEDNANIQQIFSEIPSRHQIQLNINSVMAHYKLPTISSEDFKIYCDHVFKVEAISSKRGSDLQTTIYHCSYCPLTYSDHEYLTVHLYSNHKEIIARKLVELQKSSTVDEITSFQLPCLALASTPPPPVHRKRKSKSSNSNAQNKYPCTLCGPDLKYSSYQLLRHRARVHVDYLLKAYKSPNISHNDFKSYCAHIFKVEAISSKRGRNSKGSHICNCPYCQKTMTAEFLKVHLYLKHKVIITKKLVELQKSTNFDELTAVKLPPLITGRHRRGHNECDICGKIYSDPSNLLRHKKFTCKGTDKIQKQQNRIRHSKCHDCGKIFTDPSNLSKHKKLCCEGLKESKDKFMRERIGKRYNECHVCGKVYSEPSNLLRHQKTVHRLFKTSGNKVPSIAKTIKTEPQEDEDGLESEEIAEYYEDKDDQKEMDVEKERNGILVKQEHCNDNSHVGAIIPDNDPLQF